MRIFKPLSAAAGAGVLALSMTAAPAHAAPANPDGTSPGVTVTTQAPEQAFHTSLIVNVNEGEDTITRPNTAWTCGLARLDGKISQQSAKGGAYKVSWKVAIGASYDLPKLTITLPAKSGKDAGEQWTIPVQEPTFGDADGDDVADLAPSDTHPGYHYLTDTNRVDVQITETAVVIQVPDGVRAGEYFNVELDADLADASTTPAAGSSYSNALRVDENCETPDPVSNDRCEPPTDGGSNGGTEEGTENGTDDCVENGTEECIPTGNGDGTITLPDGTVVECEGGQGGAPKDKGKKAPVKVNAGGENDNTAGLIALAMGAVVITGAATYGLRRSKK